MKRTEDRCTIEAPSIDELMKQHSGKSIPEYVEMQERYLTEEFEKYHKRRKDLLDKIEELKHKPIYVKLISKTHNIECYAKFYDFKQIEDPILFLFSYKIDEITFTSNKYKTITKSNIEIVKGKQNEGVNLDMLKSNLREDIYFINERDFLTILNIVESYEEIISKHIGIIPEKSIKSL